MGRWLDKLKLQQSVSSVLSAPNEGGADDGNGANGLDHDEQECFDSFVIEANRVFGDGEPLEVELTKLTEVDKPDPARLIPASLVGRKYDYAKHKRIKHEHRYRIQVLRVTISCFLRSESCRAKINFTADIQTHKTIEDYLDAVLWGMDCQIEEAIKLYDYYAPDPNYTLVCKCGYRPPICAC